MMTGERRRRIAMIAAVVCGVAVAWAAALAALGGFDTSVLGLRIRSNSFRNPTLLAAISLSVLVLAIGWRTVAGHILRRIRSVPIIYLRIRSTVGHRIPLTVTAVALAVASVVFGVLHGAKAGGGADSYGYISQAEMWLSGKLTIPQPWVADVPWESAATSFAPLGYHPTNDHRALVPGYAPGLPMLMAVAKRLGGQPAVFWVVPVSGGALVLATFGIGRRLGSGRAGLIAAVLVATSPVFLYMTLNPMSDIPVAAAWTLAFWCVFGEGLAWSAGGGLFAAAAILIRPNLAPMALAFLIWYADQIRHRPARGRSRAVVEMLAFGAAASCGVVVVAWLNWIWFGSPFRSGYGTFTSIFDAASVTTNIKLYLSWFVHTQTPLAIVGLAALVAPPRWIWPHAPRPAAVVSMAAFAIAIWAEYCAYAAFDVWWYLRFLLPGWPVIMLGLAGVMDRAAGSRASLREVPVLLAAIALACHGVAFAINDNVLVTQRGEDKYPTVAKLVRRLTGPDAVVLSNQHSGSIRYYGGRMTLEYGGLDEKVFDRAVGWLVQHGGHPYALLEDWEVTQVQERFGPKSALARLEMPPILIYRGISTAFLYDLAPVPGRAIETEAFVDPLDKPIYCLPPVAPPDFSPR